jgi:hypothetical protein
MANEIFPHAGYSVGRGATVGTSYTVIALSSHADELTASQFPMWCEVIDVEMERLTVESGSPTTVTMYLCRDSLGNKPITPGSTVGATATIDVGLGTAGLGGAVWSVGKDFHYAPVASTTKGILYLAAKVDAGEITAHFRVNWRGRVYTSGLV